MKGPGLLLTRACLVIAVLATASDSRRIAVVGAGAAGTAAAYFAREELLARGEPPAEIHVFERGDRVGGRAHVGTVEYNNTTLYFEQGASMFISKNRHLMEMAEKFNLTLCEHPCTYAKGKHSGAEANALEFSLGSYGIWDPTGAGGSGEWLVGPGSRWRILSIIKALWRYSGTGDLNHVQKRTDTAVKEFMQSYTDFANRSAGIYSTWSEYLSDKPLLQSSLYYRASEYYLSAGEGIRRRFLEEVVSLATRVNYMQDVDTVNTLGAHISMAAGSDTAYSVAGGNYQIFERMLAASGAQLHLHTSVTSIQRSNATAGRYTLSATSEDDGFEHDFDTVIIATPLPLANISILEDKHQDLVAAEYVHMYVTFVIGGLQPRLFPKGRIPRLVVTPYQTTDPFNCLSILACLHPEGAGNGRQCQDGPVLTKIFSHRPVDLNRIFAVVEWHRQQEWHSYPKLNPLNADYVHKDPDSTAYYLQRTPPPPIVLDRNRLRDTLPSSGIFYINGMEALFSTMESQTVAARHVVRLALAGA
ncbi:hypothetical protein H4S01_000158 [Coemansia sp. RSA 2610]|nr:hypothetical protein H4S01_000158 [Coemansia sp. RSA 2610]